MSVSHVEPEQRRPAVLGAAYLLLGTVADA
ncbi:hypothetical protein H4W81_005749 [Nonomuraea africana]|uniref:MFS transporter n=1 Tax=Nonomuraea africana TaxID=46171 RepID=A0ABR9KLT1_9ACTN|nr:hypothetical protein [Nonomuraea africana]